MAAGGSGGSGMLSRTGLLRTMSTATMPPIPSSATPRMAATTPPDPLRERDRAGGTGTPNGAP